VSATIVALAEQGTAPVFPAVITASATILGVLLAQSVSYMTRHSDERSRRRDQLADALGASLAYISDLKAELSRADRSGSNYWQLDGWQRAVSEWPAIRRQMLTLAMGHPDRRIRAGIITKTGQLTALVQEQGAPSGEMSSRLDELQRGLVATEPGKEQSLVRGTHPTRLFPGRR
jgi:hypothetical protein